VTLTATAPHAPPPQKPGEPQVLLSLPLVQGAAHHGQPGSQRGIEPSLGTNRQDESEEKILKIS
jgi:hypothetical protein